MNTLPMIREPIEYREFWFRGYDGASITLLEIGCPAWGCESFMPVREGEYLYMEHLRSHRYTPFTMEKP